MQAYVFDRPLPSGLEGLADLALDLRWTWSHATDQLWESLDSEAWRRTRNPYYVLQSVSQKRLEEAAANAEFTTQLGAWLAQRQRYLADPGWFGRATTDHAPTSIAYFSMEFGLGEALPIYSGGLGMLAGDFLKTASDLGVPVVGIGLLYQQGYFRQMLDADGRQSEAFPYNDPMMLPIAPAPDRKGGWLRIRLDLPGRPIIVRVWQVRVGKLMLYLLDSNDPMNHPPDRGATAHLYPAEPRSRLIQEIILGMGGWRVLEALDREPEICHLNEGHAAFAVLARASSFMRRYDQLFSVALRATRAGNIFTTHTPVEAGFDRFSMELLSPYAAALAEIVRVPVDDLLALGRKHPDDRNEPFNMAYLALRGSGAVNAVSALHGAVSRGIFQPLFPRWPQADVPVGYVTNGVHVPSWDSQEADALWTQLCGKDRWLTEPGHMRAAVEQVGDGELWTLRTTQRDALIRYARHRLVRQMRERGASSDQIRGAAHVLDPNALTLGFARRFAEYKRPTLLLSDAERLARLLCQAEWPVQLIVAGKAHPHDHAGKGLVQAMTQFAARADVWDRVVFLEDYDMALAQFLVAGIDVWLNTPRRPWEACGTSGMKVLVNGGLNLSELDGWWAEAYAPTVGWALGDGREHLEPEYDATEAARLYELLEQEVIPEFYTRGSDGLPHAWLTRIKTSMSQLTPQFSGNRMARDYLEQLYGPATAALRRRIANGGKVAAELDAWHQALAEGWREIRFGAMRVIEEGSSRCVEVEVYAGEINPEQLRVELYADPKDAHDRPFSMAMLRWGPIPGALNGYVYRADCPTDRPAEEFTPRIVPYHPEAWVPLEEALILWKH